MSPMNVRCVVCGAESEVSRSYYRDSQTGEMKWDEPVKDGVGRRWPGGMFAGACLSHTPDEARTALVLHGLVKS